jgi:hypothetical protein
LGGVQRDDFGNPRCLDSSYGAIERKKISHISVGKSIVRPRG